MVFSIDNKDKKTYATIQNNETVDKYECSFLYCHNPVCTCGTVTIELTPVQEKTFSQHKLSSHLVPIDIFSRKLSFKKGTKIPKERLVFCENFISQFKADDFLLLHKNHFTYKNKITEIAPIASIDGYFDYKAVEKDGAMYAYNDVLPYGDQINIIIDKKKYSVFDQYCLLPKCPCSDATLTLMPFDVTRMNNEELCSVEVDYKKGQWKNTKGLSCKISPQTFIHAVEQQIDNFDKVFYRRHLKLKGIYAHCKQKHFRKKNTLEVPQVGRNNPCPCGSGKKYKKCCLNK